MYHIPVCFCLTVRPSNVVHEVVRNVRRYKSIWSRKVQYKCIQRDRPNETVNKVVPLAEVARGFYVSSGWKKKKTNWSVVPTWDLDMVWLYRSQTFSSKVRLTQITSDRPSVNTLTMSGIQILTYWTDCSETLHRLQSHIVVVHFLWIFILTILEVGIIYALLLCVSLWNQDNNFSCFRWVFLHLKAAHVHVRPHTYHLLLK